MILSIPIDFIVVCFLKVLKEIKGLTDIQHNILYFILGIPLTMIIIGMSEYLIKGVSCSMLTAFIFSIITYLFNLFLDKKISEE
nr:YrvL family regulatory protein [Romboutsia sp. 1001713B170207_170306_H8]